MDNIIKIMTVDYEDQVNNYLEMGWLLLGFVPVTPISDLEQKHGKHQKFIIGYPRQFPCGAASFGHIVPKKYNHEAGEWYCPVCKEEKLFAKAEAEKYDDVPF